MDPALRDIRRRRSGDGRKRAANEVGNGLGIGALVSLGVGAKIIDERLRAPGVGRMQGCRDDGGVETARDLDKRSLTSADISRNDAIDGAGQLLSRLRHRELRARDEIGRPPDRDSRVSRQRQRLEIARGDGLNATEKRRSRDQRRVHHHVRDALPVRTPVSR